VKDSLDGCRLYADEHGIEVVCLHLTALKLVDTGSDSCMLVGRTVVIARPSLALQSSRFNGRTDRSRLRARRSVQETRTHELHAMAPGLVGQTIERAGGYKMDAPPSCRRQASGGSM
jgi:hypothetical protein